MLKKILLGFVIFIVVAAVLIYAFRAPLRSAFEEAVTSDMFVSEDIDIFDPGITVQSKFPDIRAFYQGQEINQINKFIKDKGAIFIANRSVDW